MKMKDLIEGDVVPLNRKLKGEMSAGDFMRALTPKEFEALMDFPEGDNLYDQVVGFAKKNYPNVTIKDEEEIPNHAKEYRVIDDDGTDTGWQKNSPPLTLVKKD